jgi:hypothetical protein
VADHGSHARHDRFAIADSIGGGTLRATVGTCPACRALQIDLLTLQGAIRAAWAPRRTRDLRLTLADATRLERRRWRQLVGLIGGPLDALTRPLALSFTALGLAGLLLTTVPAVLPMGATGGASSAELDRITVAAGSEAPTSQDPAPAIGPDPRDDAISPDPLPVLSIGLLALGAALFAVRRGARMRVR